jgi:polysaccharide pyruvyl transferase WcaK-like protein
LIYHVFANKSNVGDWLSARGIQRALSGQSVVEYFCDEPFVEKTLEALTRVSGDDLVIIGGGGLFMDYFTPFWEGFSRISGCLPYGIWGAGLCDLKRTPSRPAVGLLTEIVQNSQFCWVRDQLTRDYLVHCDPPEPIGCPSLLELTPATEPAWSVLHVDNYTTAGADVYDAMEEFVSKWARQTCRPLLRTNNRIEPGSLDNLNRTLELYRQADVILSSALHGCIIGVALGRKVIAVSGDRKIESFMESAGLGEWVCDQAEVDRLPELFSVVAEQPSRESFLSGARQKNFDLARRVLRSNSGDGKMRNVPLAFALNRKTP